MTSRGPRKKPQPFNDQIDRSGDCWRWTGRERWDGYGEFHGTGAHRVSYQRFVGPIPDGLEIDHLCRNKLCVNPAHLEAVTHEENMRRRQIAMTHCKNGHEFTPENTYWRPNPHGWKQRQCRACGVAQVFRYKARKRARANEEGS